MSYQTSQPASFPVVLSSCRPSSITYLAATTSKKQCWRSDTPGLVVDAVCRGSTCAGAGSIILEE